MHQSQGPPVETQTPAIRRLVPAQKHTHIRNAAICMQCEAAAQGSGVFFMNDHSTGAGRQRCCKHPVQSKHYQGSYRMTPTCVALCCVALAKAVVTWAGFPAGGALPIASSKNWQWATTYHNTKYSWPTGERQRWAGCMSQCVCVRHNKWHGGECKLPLGKQGAAV